MTENHSYPRPSTLRRWTGRVAWLAGGLLLFYLLLIDPLRVHPLDGWLQARLGLGQSQGAEDSTAAAELWTCPMHPRILEEEPGSCPICGMDLVPKSLDDASERSGLEMGAAPMNDDGAVRIDPAVVQNMNVRTEAASSRDLAHRIRTVGYLEYDQERMVTVTTKYSGWVEKVYANYVGEPIRKGQPLFEIYSPELVQTEQELLSALEYAARFADAAEDARGGAQGLVEAARTRLSYWDISPDQIGRLEETGEIFRTLQVTAPASGVVMKRLPGLEGMAVKPGMEIFHIADLSNLWLSAELFEDQIAWVRRGLSAEITFASFPGETFAGTVQFIEPELSEQTRSLRVKVAVRNHDRRLRAGMFATVVFTPTGRSRGRRRTLTGGAAYW